MKRYPAFMMTSSIMFLIAASCGTGKLSIVGTLGISLLLIVLSYFQVL